MSHCMRLARGGAGLAVMEQVRPFRSVNNAVSSIVFAKRVKHSTQAKPNQIITRQTSAVGSGARRIDTIPTPITSSGSVAQDIDIIMQRLNRALTRLDELKETQPRGSNRWLWLRMMSAGLLLLVLLANFSVGSYDVPFIGSKWIVRISPTAEQRLANLATMPWKNKILPVDDYRTVRIQRNLDRLSNAAGLPRHAIHIIIDDQINAFTPGVERVFISTGMLRLCRNEDEVAGVLAHEMAHGAAKYGSELFGRNALLIALAPLSIMGVLVVGTAWNLIQPQRNETEADKMGVYFTAQAQYNPGSCASVFERIHELEKKKPQRQGLELFWTHPPTEKRIKNIHALVPEAMQRFPVPPEIEDDPKFEQFFNKVKKTLRESWAASLSSIPSTWT